MHFLKHTKALAKPVILGSILVISATSSNIALSATPIGTEFSPEQRLKFSRFASKNRQNTDLNSYIQLDDKRDDAFGENNNECGNVEIGNVERPRIGQPIQNVDILIVGDVINVPGDC